MKIFHLTEKQTSDMFFDRRARMNTDVVARLLCAAFTMYPPFAALTMPDSLSGRMQIREGAVGELLFGVMAVTAILIFIDVLMNSISKVPILPLLAMLRDRLYLCAAFCSVVVPFSVSKFMSIDSGSSYLYIVIFSGSLALAWCDSYAKKNTITKKASREKTL